MSGQAFTRQRERTGAPSGPLAQSLMRPKSTHRFWRECPAATASCAVIALLTFICYRFHINNATVVLAYLLVVVVQSLTGRLVDRKSTRLNSSHRCISYAVFCL